MGTTPFNGLAGTLEPWLPQQPEPAIRPRVLNRTDDAVANVDDRFSPFPTTAAHEGLRVRPAAIRIPEVIGPRRTDRPSRRHDPLDGLHRSPMRPRHPNGASLTSRPYDPSASPRPSRRPAIVPSSSTTAAPAGSIYAALRHVGLALRAARSERRFTVLRQAALAGLTPSSVERIERGDCSASFGEVVALCSSLGLQLTAIAVDTAPRQKSPG